MRDNGAVSGHEIELGDDQIIISRSDKQGRIVHVNPSFVEISGYTEDELLGQPHNIIRHPDVPCEVFADLWTDLTAGRPWTSVVKNRCKNGDAYWVEAHISPIWDRGEISGYLSMRRKPSREQILAAERSYAAMRSQDGKSGLIFEHGSMTRKGLWNSLQRKFGNSPLAIKFILSALLPAIVVLGATVSFLAAHLTQELNENARQQLRHDVSLLRAAVAARVESANIEVVEYSKTLSERIYEAMGGERKASLARLESLTRQDASSRSNPIDFFMRDLRGVATIFVLTPEGFQRRMTAATEESGGSAVGTYLATDHPAYATLIAGKPYVGPARVFGHQYLTCYTPIFNASGAVIGTSVIGIDIADQLATLKSQIRSMKIGKTGYYYIADTTPGSYFGTMILHPYREGQNLVDVQERTGRGLLAEMANQRQGEIHYSWKNAEAGETTERMKMVIFESLDNPQWIVAGGSSIDEFTALSDRIVWMVIAGGLTMAAAIFMITLILLRNLVLKPLNNQVLPTFHAMSAGRYNTPLDVRGNDEMSRAVQGLESLRNRLAFESERERTLAKLHETARQEAENLSRARAEFLANMSHEIRTPLNAVIGLAYLLLKTNQPPREMEYVKRIEGAGKLLLAIINDILDFSKIDAGRMQLEEAPFRLDDVLDNLSNLLRNRVQEKGLVLDYVVTPDTPQALRGDALRLSQILINLVSNAIKFTAEGSITVYVNVTARSNKHVELEFRVRDTGIGMSDEQISNLFRAFSQADGSVTRKFGGTGLGLVISKRLVEMMSGSIWVDSHPQAGSVFGFTVRLGIEDATTPPIARKGYRVLVVDDNDLARMVLERLLNNIGCVVQSVNSGEAALTELRNAGSAPFDCVMADLNMPNMDGLALGHHIRAEVGQATKLVMVTSENIHTSQYINALGNFDDIVEKPVTAARISEVISQLQAGPKSQSARIASMTAPLAGLRILVAEDVPTNQLIMRDLLESLGATISMADNGILALEKLASAGDNVDLILMDIQMPKMDGLEATRRIRAGKNRAEIPIIALTAHALEEERQRALEAGMNDFLTKPIEPARLIAVIQHWKPQQKVEAEQPALAPPTSPDIDIPVLPGIDVEDGLRRMLNRRPLYEKVLRDFHARFAGEADRIRKALAAKDIETATRLVHTIKGTGGMIGALALASLAAELEQAIKAGAPETSARLDQFERSLSQVIGSIGAAYGLGIPD